MTMISVYIKIKVKPEHVDAFIAASRANGAATEAEPGNIRFDMFQSKDDPTQFSLIEVYESKAAQDAHFAT
ncbi:MAG: putative quinol monooxygenase, partial [Chloroflexota bacterium]